MTATAMGNAAASTRWRWTAYDGAGETVSPDVGPCRCMARAS